MLSTFGFPLGINGGSFPRLARRTCSFKLTDFPFLALLRAAARSASACFLRALLMAPAPPPPAVVLVVFVALAFLVVFFFTLRRLFFDDDASSSFVTINRLTSSWSSDTRFSANLLPTRSVFNSLFKFRAVSFVCCASTSTRARRSIALFRSAEERCACSLTMSSSRASADNFSCDLTFSTSNAALYLLSSVVDCANLCASSLATPVSLCSFSFALVSSDWRALHWCENCERSDCM